MKARLEKQVVPVTQVGAKPPAETWVLSFPGEGPFLKDSETGWRGAVGPSREMRLYFPSRQAAERYGRDTGVEWEDVAFFDPEVRPNTYGENFRRRC